MLDPNYDSISYSADLDDDEDTTNHQKQRRPTLEEIRQQNAAKRIAYLDYVAKQGYLPPVLLACYIDFVIFLLFGCFTYIQLSGSGQLSLLFFPPVTEDPKNLVNHR